MNARRLRWVCAVLLAGAPPWALGQSAEFQLGPDGRWVEQPGPAPGSDEAALAEARRLLAEDKPERAKEKLDAWIEERGRSDSPWVAQAHLLRGDALAAMDDTWESLFDYEAVILQFPGSQEFAKAVERELDIGLMYINGATRLQWGFWWVSAYREGVELLIRVQERLPGSALAERAAIELADYYYRERELELAGEAYEVFLKNFPRSEHRSKAMLRRVIVNIARFNGPRYDASGLQEAKGLIAEFNAIYPAEAQRAGLDQELVDRLNESMAAKMLDRARYYERRGDPVSARFTMRRLIERHPTTGSAAEAIAIMNERGWEAGASEAKP